MTCGSCESIVEQRVGSIDGVQTVTADSEAESIVAEGPEGIQEAVAMCIQNTGYDVVS